MDADPPLPLPVSTARLELRYVEESDAAGLACTRDPDVCRYLPFGPRDDAQLAERLARMVAARRPTAPGHQLSLAVTCGTQVIGDLMLRLGAGLNDESPPGIGELGWVFAPSYGGRGYATEAASALVDLAFTCFPLHRLEARLDPENLASARVCERLGMRLEAHTRRDYPAWTGEWTDTAVYGLLREEWAADRG